MPKGKKSESKREAAALLLARGFTIRQAAHKCDVGERTLQVWLKEGPFATRVRELRSVLLTRTFAKLTDAGVKAVQTLMDRMLAADEKGNVRVSAANTLLTHLFRGVEMMDLAERVAALEAGAAGS